MGKIHSCPIENPVINFGSYAQKGAIPWNKGKTGVYSEEALRKMSETSKKVGKGKWFKGVQRREENNHNWKGGISKICSIYNSKRRTLLLNADGTHTAIEWQELKSKYNHICPACGKREPEIKISEDHIIPLTKGGTNFISNIQPICRNCNSKKHTREDNFLLNFL